MTDCGYCTKQMTKQEHSISGAFQAYPEPAKPSCGSATCLKQAKVDAEAG